MSGCAPSFESAVMPGLGPGIHDVALNRNGPALKPWMAGPSPAMTPPLAERVAAPSSRTAEGRSGIVSRMGRDPGSSASPPSGMTIQSVDGGAAT